MALRGVYLTIRYWLLAVILIISMPIILYIYKFGFGLWGQHSGCSNMGGFFGGILGPVLAAMSLVFLGY